MKYRISYLEPHKHFIDIELTIEDISSDLTYLQTPAWRPGRYELQNYARNFQKFEVSTKEGNPVQFKKVNRNQWEVQTKGVNSLTVKYNCYCAQMDAGGAWLDEEQLYLNLIYCLIYVVGRDLEKSELTVVLPKNYKVGCGLPKDGDAFYANSFFQLADSPLIASPTLIAQQYEVQGIPFHIWMQGDVSTDWSKVLTDFKKFTQESISLFGEFPEKDYHFLYEILHSRFHHGVEHSNSTVIVLGPSENFNTNAFYENFLGISCHELFHAWNALKIRPKEMMPYDLTKENYFKTGFVIEGVTTYYGDYLLARCGVLSVDQYFKELNSVFQKHFENFGRYNMSVADSSYDLWVDGYVPGIPNRKVSIYGKGCIVALILDLEIRKTTKNEKSLDDVMRILWKEFGKVGTGYSEEDYQKVVEHVAGQSMQEYFSHCIYGIDPVENELKTALNYVGCDLAISPSTCNSERTFGFQTCKREGKYLVDIIEPGSPADKVLTKDDEIVAVNDIKVENNFDQLIGNNNQITLSVIRFGKLITRKMESDGKNYLHRYTIKKRSDASEDEKINFQKWIKNEF